jgi:hypothetical protein
VKGVLRGVVSGVHAKQTDGEEKAFRARLERR